MEENIDIAETVPEIQVTTPAINECEICGKEFKNVTGLKIHMNSHKLKKRKRAPQIKTQPSAYDHDVMKTEEQKSNPNEPWRPASILTAFKKAGMRPRWVRKDLLEKRVEEGWQPRMSDSRNRVESPEKTIVDGIPLGNYVTKRNMVLCDMPEEMARSRESYFKRINDEGLKAQKQQFVSETVAGGESHAYGDIKVER